jgi:hypothetical protein
MTIFSNAPNVLMICTWQNHSTFKRQGENGSHILEVLSNLALGGILINHSSFFAAVKLPPVFHHAGFHIIRIYDHLGVD